VLAALGRRDVDRLIALSHPDVEWHSFFASLGDEGVFRGHDGTRRYMAALDESWEVGYAEVDDGLACGQLAVFVGRIRYRGRESHLEASAEAGWVLVFRDGKLVRFQAFREPERVLEDLGR
jgi:ketosteroid isomerase-like protein